MACVRCRVGPIWNLISSIRLAFIGGRKSPRTFLISLEAVSWRRWQTIACLWHSLFMSKVYKREELGTRDTFARAIDMKLKRLGASHVLLDIFSVKDPEFIKEHFPTIFINAAWNMVTTWQRPNTLLCRCAITPAVACVVNRHSATDIDNLNGHRWNAYTGDFMRQPLAKQLACWMVFVFCTLPACSSHFWKPLVRKWHYDSWLGWK